MSTLGIYELILILLAGAASLLRSIPFLLFGF